MKLTFSHRAILPALFISLAGLSPALAQSATTNAANGTQLPPPMLDNDEMMQLQKAREQVLEANPDLKAEEEKLKALHESAQQTPAPTPEQRTAAFAEWKDYQKKMRAAMLKIDPTLGPLFAKLDKAAKHHSQAAPTPPPAQ